MTSCRPSRRTSLPSLGGTTRIARVSLARGRALPRAGLLELVTRYLRPGVGQWKRQDLLRSWETQCALALLSDPGRTNASGHCNAPARPPLCPRRRLPHSYFRGSITRLRHSLSTPSTPVPLWCSPQVLHWWEIAQQCFSDENRLVLADLFPWFLGDRELLSLDGAQRGIIFQTFPGKERLLDGDSYA